MSTRQGEAQADIRGVMISVSNARLLLPNATVAEVITFAEPDPIADAPPWLLGRVRWRGWRLPLLSFSKLAGLAQQEGELGAKVAVLKSLGEDRRLSYFALLTQGFPRLTTVSHDALIELADADPAPGVRARVMLRDDEAIIPDLDAIERMIVEVVARAA